MSALILHFFKRLAESINSKNDSERKIRLLWLSLTEPTFKNTYSQFCNNSNLLRRNKVKVTVEYLVKAGAVMALLLLLAPMAKAQDVVIPDANFKAALVANLAINTNEDTEIQVSEATAYDGTIDVAELQIADLTGIEAFVSIKQLMCNENELTELDLSQNLVLTSLTCSFNSLTELDVSLNQALIELNCRNNKLTNMDLSENHKLEVLICQQNRLTSLSLSTNSALESITCPDNKLSTLDVSGAPSLVSLTCDSNELTDLNVSTNQALEQLVCGDNQLSTLDLAACTSLSMLGGSYNKLSTLDLSANTDLLYLGLSDNQLSELDLSANDRLEWLLVDNNRLKTINLGAHTGLYEISVRNNLLTSLDVSAFTLLEELNCANNELTTLDVSNNVALKYLNCSNLQLAELTRTRSLDAENPVRIVGKGNKLTSLDLRTNVDLEGVICAKNQLTHLDVRNGNNSILRYLIAEDNLLTCIVVDDVLAEPSRWTKDAATTYCSGLPTAVDLRSESIITNQSTLPVTIVFDEEVSGFELSDIDVSNGMVANLHSSDQITYTADLTPLQEGIVSLNLDGHQVENALGDPNAPAPELSINYDLTAPSALIITSATTAAPVLVTVLFSEEVKGFELADLSVANGSAAQLETTDGQTYTFELTPTQTGRTSVDLPADQLTDLAGNENLAAPSLTFEFEIVLGWSEAAQEHMLMYPNPAKDEIHIQLADQSLAAREIQITLTNMDGKQLLNEKTRFDESGSVSINLAPYPPGLYVLQFSEESIQFQKKILKR